MDMKLDILLSDLKSLKRRISMLEENDEHNIDEKFANVNKL